MHFTKHIVADMDDSMIQRCLICGTVISDYQNTFYPKDQEPTKGFPAGEIYVSGGTPKISTVEPPQNVTISDCKSS